jgi:hypothetical protein
MTQYTREISRSRRPFYGKNSLLEVGNNRIFLDFARNEPTR